MAIPVPRVTQPQLERACGGAKNLLQLVDVNRSGQLTDPACQSLIAEVLAEANGVVNGIISPAIDITDPQVQTAPLLVRYEIDIAYRLIWMRGTGGISTPEQVIAADEYARGELAKIKERGGGIGLTTRPSSSQPIQEVTDDLTTNYYNTKGPRRRFDGWS